MRLVCGEMVAGKKVEDSEEVKVVGVERNKIRQQIGAHGVKEEEEGKGKWIVGQVRVRQVCGDGGGK